jgi:hypothetical protein
MYCQVGANLSEHQRYIFTNQALQSVESTNFLELDVGDYFPILGKMSEQRQRYEKKVNWYNDVLSLNAPSLLMFFLASFSWIFMTILRVESYAQEDKMESFALVFIILLV